MNYYKQGDAANADKIKAAFKEKGYRDQGWIFSSKHDLYFSVGTLVYAIPYKIRHIITERSDYKELKLPVEPMFKAEDRIVSKSDKSTIYRIITLHDERREYIVEIEHQDYHESCPWIAFEDQDDYELAPKPHYNLANFKPKQCVLTRDTSEWDWELTMFAYLNSDGGSKFTCINGVTFKQCIPFEGNEHLLGTTDMPSEEFINW